MCRQQKPRSKWRSGFPACGVLGKERLGRACTPRPRDAGVPSLLLPSHLRPYSQEGHTLELCSQKLMAAVIALPPGFQVPISRRK